MKVRFLLFGIFIATTSLAQKNKPNAYQESIRCSTDSIRKFILQKNIPGLAITVYANEKKVWSEGFGFVDLENHVAVDPQKTKFRIGSISKALTAAGLARLFEAQKIILDSSIYFYLPDYPKYRYRPTLRQLAGHLAGIRHYKGDEFYSSRRYQSVSEGLSMFKDDTLLFKPGTQYQYSSYGFNLLSAAMEQASGKDFLRFMKEEVFDPLGLKNTVPDMNDSIIDHRTRFYMKQGNRWLNAPPVDNSYKWAGGGFLSTSEDIAAFGNALLTTTFLKKETLQYFTTPQKLENGNPTTYGLGFSCRKDKQGRFYFGHSGGSVGGTSDMVIYPEEKVVVVLLTNLSNASLGNIANQIAELFMKGDDD